MLRRLKAVSENDRTHIVCVIVLLNSAISVDVTSPLGGLTIRVLEDRQRWTFSRESDHYGGPHSDSRAKEMSDFWSRVSIAG
jgi:hypothetical protein